MASRIKTRIRFNVKKLSIKQGYSPDFTIEAEWEGQDFTESTDDEEALYRFGALIKELEQKAFEEVNFLNAREGYPTIGSGSIKREEFQEGNITTVTERVERIDQDAGEIFDEEQ